MRLLDAEALIYDNVAELADFPDETSAPPYAILSHTWEEEEVLFHDIALGPQHEIRPTVVSLRAMRRRRTMLRRNSNISTSEEPKFDGSDENSSDTTRSHSLSDSAEKRNVTSSNRGQCGPTLLANNSLGTRGKSGIGLLMPRVKAGWTKVLNACLQTLRDGLAYIWIDTCKSQPS
jgi:hypothetical protein